MGIPKSVINNALYALKSRGDITSVPQTPPLWAFNRESNSVKEDERSLINLLSMKASPMSIHSIAWEMNESKARINRILYNLEKFGKVERLQISPPVWALKVDGSGHDLVGEKKVSGSKKRPIEAQGNIQDTIINRKKRFSYKANERSEVIIPEFDRCTSQLQTHHPTKNRIRKLWHTSDQNGDVDSKLCEKIATAVWSKFHALRSKAEEVMLAGYVLRTKHEGKDEALEVVALGTGPGDKYCLTGTAVHDCHAEIIARRSLLRWLYQQLETADNPKSYAIKNKGDEAAPFKMRPCFELWLYCSQAPCGDAAVFSLADPLPTEVPCFTTACNNQGKFRTKTEASHGGNVMNVNEPSQSFDALQLGIRSKCLTCSDKLAKRCYLGIQGALLSRLIPPVFMSGIVIGNVFSHGHVSRALCCRSEKAVHTTCDGNFTNMASSYSVHHPKIGYWPYKMNRDQQIRIVSSKTSLNWALGDEHVEDLNASTGRTGTGGISRISKKALYSKFLRVGKTSSQITYKQAKAQSEVYQLSKKKWIEYMCKYFHTCWPSKPPEVEDFN